MVPGSTLYRTRLSPREIVGVTQNAIQSFAHHCANRMAAALAYYTLFSLFPLLLVLLSVIGFLLDAGWPVALDVRGYLVEATSELLPQAGELVSGAIESVRRARGTSGLIGILALLWSASNTFNHLHIALDQIWGVNGSASLGLTVRRRGKSLALVLVMVLLLIVAHGFKSVTYVLATVSDQVPGGSSIYRVLMWALPFIVSILAFGTIYWSFPSVPISSYDVWPGAVLAGIGWELLKWLFGLYAVEFANWNAVYGPIASVIALLTWLYLSFTVLLFGAAFSAEYSVRLRTRPERVPESAPEAGVPVPVAAVVRAEEDNGHTERRGRPSLTAGAVAGVVGALAVAGVGIGLLVGSGRREEEPDANEGSSERNVER
jgi:membrane protein